MWDSVKYFFGALFEGLGLVRSRDAEKNAPEIKANASARAEQEMRDEATREVAEGDVDKLRRDLSE